MLVTKIYPDVIAVDGMEGATGAAPTEFMNSVGMPIEHSIVFVHNALKGCGIRHHIKIIASGKNVSSFDMIKKIALAQI